MNGGYLSAIYSESERPKSDYPFLLAKRLMKVHSIKPGSTLVDLGAGRGEVTIGFAKSGIKVYAVDRDETYRLEMEKEGIKFISHDIGSGPLPFQDNSIDIVYSKSFLEHLINPEPILEECFRILKPNGKMLHLVPDWESNYKIYFDDHTHKTPFTTVTMRDLYKICGFEPGEIRRFRQLPVTWKYSLLKYPLDFLSFFIHPRTKNKFLRWTRELMIEGVGYKRLKILKKTNS